MNVRYIVKETNSQIVLTSTWRKNRTSLDANGKVPSTQLNKDYIIVTSEPSVNDLVDGQLAYILNSDDDGIIGYSATSKTIVVSTQNQTVFSFTSSDGWSDKLLIMFVYKNGLFKAPSIEYTTSSKSITFTSGCNVNDVISIIFLNNY